MLLVAVAGFGFISVSGACNTIVQSLVDDQLRGRVLSLYGLALLGTTPFGNLALGWFSQLMPVHRAIALFGLLLFICSIVFTSRLKSLRAEARPIYLARGLISWENESLGR